MLRLTYEKHVRQNATKHAGLYDADLICPQSNDGDLDMELDKHATHASAQAYNEFDRISKSRIAQSTKRLAKLRRQFLGREAQ